MADLSITNLNIKSDKYIKKKLSLRRKFKGILFAESFFVYFECFISLYKLFNS